jgi:hypothetical protein
MFNDKINDKFNEESASEESSSKNSEIRIAEEVTSSRTEIFEKISRSDFPRLKVGVVVSPRADGLFVGTFDDALIIDLPGARTALALCDGSNSISAISTLVGILESDLIELVLLFNNSALVTFEKIANPKLLSEMQLNDWYQQSTSANQQETMEKRANATVYISKLNRIGFALSGTLLASGIGTVVSDDNRKITLEDLVGGYLRLSDVGRSRSEVLVDQSRENTQSKNSSNVKNPNLIISTAPPDPELLAEWMRGSTPFFLIDGLDRDNLTFGPFVNPGKDACPRCIDLHCLDRDPNWNSVTLAHFLDRRRELSTPLALLGASMGAIFALAQIEDRTSSQFPLRGKTITYSASELTHPIIRRWSRHPLCGCSWQ